ncbi:MAG: hypothetical protein HZB18_02520 [Chloroflexi bacterium]|nr:hypothetical protein [Chloroflexota bacterium]
MNRKYLFTLLVCISLTACQSETPSIPTPTPTITPARLIPTPRYDAPAAGQIVATATSPTVRPEATATRNGTSTPASPSITKTQTKTETPIPDEWMELPVPPEPDESIREIYERGISLGNDPNAFSIFGDCQTRPAEFFGVFETDPLVLENLTLELRETVERFNGSFNRESSTVQDGTTPGALLWDQWHRGEYGCVFGETPVECELRTHRPSFVIIQIGTHFESRNTDYLRMIITQLIDAGVVPILATKADNRELDNRINRDMALLAEEFNLPLWNFWAALSDLPDRGLYVMKGREKQGAIYLNEEAAERHRMTGLEALNIVWRMATGGGE